MNLSWLYPIAYIFGLGGLFCWVVSFLTLEQAQRDWLLRCIALEVLAITFFLGYIATRVGK